MANRDIHYDLWQIANVVGIDMSKYNKYRSELCKAIDIVKTDEQLNNQQEVRVTFSKRGNRLTIAPISTLTIRVSTKPKQGTTRNIQDILKELLLNLIKYNYAEVDSFYQPTIEAERTKIGNGLLTFVNKDLMILRIDNVKFILKDNTKYKELFVESYDTKYNELNKTLYKQRGK